jgi:mRNA interferase RelE/StbE
MKKISMTKSAAKAWDSLDAKQYKQVGRAIVGLMSNQTPHDSSTLKGAKNGERRVDVGEYRVIYADTEDAVEILVIGKRDGDEVYDIWKRMVDAPKQ